MDKTCNKENCNNPRFGGGFCRWHQGYRTDKGVGKNTLSSEKGSVTNQFKKTRLKPISDKMSKKLAEYRIVRDEFLKDNPTCEICGKTPVELHHKKPRAYFLTDVSVFMSVCRTCHTRIEVEHAWARENGYKLDHL